MNQTNINIFSLFFGTLKSIKFIITFTSFFIISLIYVLLLIDNKYESKTILYATDKESDLASMAGQFSGLAAMAGVKVPGADKISNSDVALEVLRSEDFFIKIYQYPDFLPNLLAYDTFDPQTKKSTYKAKKYDINSKKWVRDVSYPKKITPSLREAYKEFYKNYFTISKDEKTGVITLSIIHESPYIAQNWLNFIVENINQYMKDIEVKRATKALEFLSIQMSATQNKELLEVLASMAEAKYQTIMLSEVGDEFVFRSIQKASFTNFKKSPNRTYLLIFFSSLFGVLMTFIALVCTSFNKKIVLIFLPPRIYLEDI